MSKQLPPIDDEVYAALQRSAVPLEDDINSVLRRLLGLDFHAPSSDPPTKPGFGSGQVARTPAKRSRKAGKKRTRAPKGSVLPESEYELPILKALFDLGGRGPTSEVVALVEKYLDPKLTEMDRATLSGGDTRWKNRTQFVRLKLVKDGLMESGSPRGTWEISELGRKYLMEADG